MGPKSFLWIPPPRKTCPSRGLLLGSMSCSRLHANDARGRLLWRLTSEAAAFMRGPNRDRPPNTHSSFSTLRGREGVSSPVSRYAVETTDPPLQSMQEDHILANPRSSSSRALHSIQKVWRPTKSFASNTALQSLARNRP